MNVSKTRLSLYGFFMTFNAGFMVLILLFALAPMCFSANQHQEKEFLPAEKWEQITKGQKYFDKSISREEIKMAPGVDVDHPDMMPDWIAHILNFTRKNWQFFVYGLLIVLLAVLIYFVISEKILLQSPKKNAGTSHPTLDNFDEETPESHLERLLREARKEKYFAAAVRIRFILLLRFLNDKNLVRFSIDKTNRKYLDELYKNECFEDFKKLVLIFENVWYGKLALNQQDFNQIDSLFNLFTQRFTAHEK